MRKSLFFVVGFALGAATVLLSACSSVPQNPREAKLDQWIRGDH